jgi:BA14K-like protein
MQRFLAIVGAGILGVVALWLALVSFAVQAPTDPPAHDNRRSSGASVAPKLRDVTVNPAPTTGPRVAAPAAVPKIDPPAGAAAPAASPAPAPQDPQPGAAPGAAAPVDEQTATVDPTEGDAVPGTAGTRFPRGSAGCTRYKTYDPETQTYRGYDGIVRPCRPI